MNIKLRPQPSRFVHCIHAPAWHIVPPCARGIRDSCLRARSRFRLRGSSHRLAAPRRDATFTRSTSALQLGTSFRRAFGVPRARRRPQPRFFRDFSRRRAAPRPRPRVHPRHHVEASQLHREGFSASSGSRVRSGTVLSLPAFAILSHLYCRSFQSSSLLLHTAHAVLPSSIYRPDHFPPHTRFIYSSLSHYANALQNILQAAHIYFFTYSTLGLTV
ncbi:hypothetical protein C8J57DRAFT_1584807, partial [Mycena rebaudengoi]